MAARKPPAAIPVGDVTDALLAPFEALLSSGDLTPETERSVRTALTKAKEQRTLINAKFSALDAQVQALLAQFDWTK